MKKWVFIGAFLFVSNWVLGCAVKDTLILDGWAVELDQDSLTPLSSEDIRYWEQDLKSLPPVIIWHASLGASTGIAHQAISLSTGRELLSQREKGIADHGWQAGAGLHVCTMLTNNIGIGIGAAFSQYRFSSLSAKFNGLTDGQLPYRVSCQGSNVEWIIQQSVGADLYELDTLVSPIDVKIQNVQLFQFPVLLRYVKESRSEVWRFHAAMGALLQRIQLPSLEYAWIEKEELKVTKVAGTTSWSNVPMMMMQVDRALSAKNSVFVQLNAIWPKVQIAQGIAQIHLPNVWISMGWNWKFNNNPYIRAR